MAEAGVQGDFKAGDDVASGGMSVEEGVVCGHVKTGNCCLGGRGKEGEAVGGPSGCPWPPWAQFPHPESGVSDSSSATGVTMGLFRGRAGPEGPQPL